MDSAGVPGHKKYYAILLIGLTSLGAGKSCCSNTDSVTDIVGDPPVCVIQPTAVDFGQVAVGSPRERVVEATNDGGVYAGALQVAVPETFDCPGLTIAPIRATVEAEETTEITLTYMPSEPGVLGCTIPFEGSHLSLASAVPCAPVTVYGEAISSTPGCVVEPLAIDFGLVIIGTAVDTAVEVSNDNPFGTDLFVHVDPSFGCSGVMVDLDTLAVPAEASATIGVSYAPADPGTMECTLPLLGSSETEDVDCAAVDLAGSASASTIEWETCLDPAMSALFSGVFGGSAGEVYAAGEGGRVLEHTGGCQWTEYIADANVDLTGIWLTGTDDVWVVGYDSVPEMFYAYGTILSTSDPAAQWTVHSSDTRFDYNAVWGSSGCDVYFVGMGVSTDFPNAKHYDCDAGLTDLQIDLGMSDITGIHGTASDDVWAVLGQTSYQLYHSDGSEWVLATESWMDQPLRDVWATASGHVYTVGNEGTIYHWDGSQWLDESRSTDLDFYGVWAAETGQVFVVGEAGVGYRFDGSQWLIQPTPTTNDLYDVWGASDAEVFAVGRDIILRYGEFSQP